MKTETKHTPGPWHYGDEHVNPHTEFTCFGIGNGAASVAKVMVYPAIGRDEARANAALIASAPDLLAQRDELAAALKQFQQLTNNLGCALTEEQIIEATKELADHSTQTLFVLAHCEPQQPQAFPKGR